MEACGDCTEPPGVTWGRKPGGSAFLVLNHVQQNHNHPQRGYDSCEYFRKLKETHFNDTEGLQDRAGAALREECNADHVGRVHGWTPRLARHDGTKRERSVQVMFRKSPREGSRGRPFLSLATVCRVVLLEVFQRPRFFNE
jgi:hypothetical protein